MLLPKQCWKDIEGYEGLYQVSNTGKVRSLNYRRTGKTKVMKPSTDKDGYKCVNLRKNGKRMYKVHRLVAITFIPNPNNWPQVNHKDEDKTNNAVWNLEWCTLEYNINYGTRTERMSINNIGKHNHHGKNNPRAKAILMFTLEGVFIRRFDCIKDAITFLGKNTGGSNIHKCATGVYKQVYGYKWKYEEE